MQTTLEQSRETQGERRLEAPRGVRDMLQELARPIALVLCMTSLCAVFYTAFLVPAADPVQCKWDSLVLLSLAAGISLSGGMLFREPAQRGAGRLLRTLPVQVFCWALGMMLLLFASSWYVETQGIFYKDVRRF
jgi:hypothetical protein